MNLKIEARAAYERLATFIAQLYLSHHYNAARAKFESKIERDRSVIEIDADTAAKRIIEEHSMPMQDHERNERWFLTGGSVSSVETLQDYANSWRLSRARARRRGQGTWFWKSKRRPIKLNYRPFYQDLSMREQMPIASDIMVYRHALANGVDVSKYFVTAGFEGGKGKDAFQAVCTADAWKVEYCEEHKLDPNEDYSDAA